MHDSVEVPGTSTNPNLFKPCLQELCVQEQSKYLCNSL